jgi:addiction module HigA family antidote
MTKKISAIHPGEILMEEFLKPFKISQYRLAKDIAVAPIRIGEIVRGNRAISADTALRLGKYFNISPEFWLNLQSHYELTLESEAMNSVLKNKVKVFEFAACNKN